MKLTFLGTSAGAPTRQRNVTALALAIDDSRDWYLIDCGEGTQHQLLHSRYSAARLRAIFITHVHGDHCYGLPGLIASANMHGRRDPLTICAPAGIEEYVSATFAHTDMRQLRFPLNFVRSDCEDFSYDDGHIQTSVIAMSHRVPCFAYQISEHTPYHLDESALAEYGVPRGPLWNQLQQGQAVQLENGSKVSADAVRQQAWQPRRVIIGGDNDKPELLADALKSSDLLVHEATFTEDVLAKVGPQYMHSTAAMVAKVAAQTQLSHLVLTHFSQRYRLKDGGETQHSIADLRREAEAIYSGNLLMAEDFYSLHLTRDRELHVENDSRYSESR